MEIQLRKMAFTLPSGYSCEIREQNGEDEEILSNPSSIKNFMNINEFIAGIVTHTDFTASGKLLVSDVMKLPLLDRAVILINSRIFSLGEELEFNYKWPRPENSKDQAEFTYTQDLKDYLFEDYSKQPTEEELASKPDAVPYYLVPEDKKNEGKVQLKDLTFTLTSGKEIMWDVATVESEQYLMKLGMENISRNKDLLARNLRLKVEGNWEKVQNFKLFSVKDMAEMRKEISSLDPSFTGTTDIEDPITHNKAQVSILAVPTFFYLTEA